MSNVAQKVSIAVYPWLFSHFILLTVIFRYNPISTQFFLIPLSLVDLFRPVIRHLHDTIEGWSVLRILSCSFTFIESCIPKRLRRSSREHCMQRERGLGAFSTIFLRFISSKWRSISSILRRNISTKSGLILSRWEYLWFLSLVSGRMNGTAKSRRYRRGFWWRRRSRSSIVDNFLHFCPRTQK